MEERKKTQVADMDRGVYDIKNNFEYSYIADAGLTEDIIKLNRNGCLTSV